MSFQQGLSGLNASSRNLEVIGNNIANANTVGAKASRAEFADLYASSFNGSSGTAPGIGVNPGYIAQQFTAGSISTTGNPTDLAINGGGFFQVTDEKNPTQYTRNGQFKLDKDGYMVNNQGLKLMGYTANFKGEILPGSASPIQLPTSGVDPTATTTNNLDINLDSRVGITTVPVTTPPTTPPAADKAKINIQDPSTYNNATSTTVYDIKGQPITLTYYFQKAATDTWNVYATANGQSINGITTPAEAVTAMAPLATITFPTNGGAPLGAVGKVVPYTYDTAGAQTPGTAITGNATFNLPTIPAVTLKSGGLSEPIGPVDPAAVPPTAAMTLNLAGFTQYGTAFGVTKADIDGYAPGNLTGVTIENNGILTAKYSNGKTKPAGQLELATFRNPNGMQPLGGNSWAQTAASGDPVRNIPGEGNLGSIQAGAVEESNVDLTVELVNMMTAQRVYQANAQTIKTQDQIMSTLVNLR